MLDPLSAAVRMAQKVRLVVVEAAASSGMPRVACARTLSALQGRRIALAGWYAPDVASGLRGSPGLAIVVWDESTGSGYEITGTPEGIPDYSGPGSPHLAGDAGRPLRGDPELYVCVEKVVAFGAEAALAAAV